MKLDINELLELEKDVKSVLDDNLERIIINLNASDNLGVFLEMIGMFGYLNSKKNAYSDGTIIVIGQSDISKDKIIGVAKEFGLAKDRFEFYLEYEDAKTANLRKTQWSSNYSCILVGPMPHNGETKGDSSSIITELENADGYPPVVRMGKNGLKISKTSFREAVKCVLEKGIVTV